MRFRTSAPALAALALLAACSDDPALPYEPAIADVTVCSVNDVRRAAGRYLEGDDKQAAFALVNTMQTTDAAARRDAAFDLLRLIGIATDAGRQSGTPADGSVLANETIGCTGHGMPGTIDFAAALGADGAFAVRGGSADPAGPVLSRGTPMWGTEPALGRGWSDVAGARILVYGSRLASFASAETVVGNAFDWNRIPDAAFVHPVRVGACIGATVRALVQHQEAGPDASVLPPDPVNFCPGAVRLDGMSAALASGPGGRKTTFSPFAVVDAQATVLAYAQQPVDGTTGLLAPIEVSVTGSGGTPIEGAEVALTVAGNRGSFTFGGTHTQTTNGNGIATFDDLTLDKPGGYTFTAHVAHWTFEPATAVSNLINLKFP